MTLKPTPTMLSRIVDNMRRTFVSFLFPPRCGSCGSTGSWLCRDCVQLLNYTPYQRCAVCGRAAIGGYTHPICETRYTASRNLSVFEYREPLRKAIHSAKYRYTWNIFAELTEHAASWIDLMGIRFLPGAVLVPVPLHYLRKWERGYNQSRILAQYLGKRISLPVAVDCLTRTRFTQSQTRLSKDDRSVNVRDAFKCRLDLTGQNIVLIDDVFSTGSTLRAATKELKKHHARTVWCFSLARS